MNDEIKIEKDSGRDMTPRLIRDLGMRYPTEKSGRKHRYSFGVYECQYCGKEFEAITKNVKKGNTRSCGCLYNGQPTHGLKYNRFYPIWNAMVQRCTNLKNKRYKDYGGRGIILCKEWLDVANFVAWCELTHPNIEGVSLDRINNDKGYSPENCRWVDATTQNINRRISKNNKSGYNGIIWNKKNSNWKAVIGINTKKVYIGSFLTIEEAVQARDNYIIENKLPHKLSTDYKKEK